ncbi:MAG: hypothetical protein ACXVX3_05065 [Blastococcus sp.]
MTVVVPEPLPLELPAEDPDALADLVRGVAGAAYCLATLDGDLAGVGHRAPGWLGADADAAAAQVGTVVTLVRRCSTAVLAAVGRLSEHAELVTAARRAVAALRAEQDDDFAATWARLSRLDDLGTAVRADAPEAVAVVEDLRAAEEGRRRRHAALLDDVAADAAGTVRVLAEAGAVVGGRGAPGDASRVVAFLAAELPGWGDRELTARGLALAQALAGGLGTREWVSAARDAAPYAGQASFAAALLLGLGVDGIRQLLCRLGETDVSAGRVVARLLGRALGAVQPAGTARDQVGELLTAGYVDAAGPGLDADLVVLGMGAVLAATRPGDGPPLRTVLGWGRQMLARERLQAGSMIGSRAVDRARPAGGSVPPADPVALVAERLVGADDPDVAAALLGDRLAWTPLLARPWDDGGAALVGLVARAGRAQGAAGDVAVRAGLEALGAGLDDGDPADWTVDRGTAATVAPALGAALAGHVSVAAEVLWEGVRGEAGAGAADALRGLGYLTLDEGAAVAVYRALAGWSQVQPGPVGETGPLPLLPGVVVPAAYVAVEEYGQRLAYSLHGYELKAQAERRALGWNLTVGVPATLARGGAGFVGGILADYAAMWLGTDGTWHNGPDRGLVFDRGDAVATIYDGRTTEEGDALRALAAQAADAYDRTAEVLGAPGPPVSPVSHWWTPLVNAFQPGPDDLRKKLPAMRGTAHRGQLADLSGMLSGPGQ